MEIESEIIDFMEVIRSFDPAAPTSPESSPAYMVALSKVLDFATIYSTTALERQVAAGTVVLKNGKRTLRFEHGIKDRPSLGNAPRVRYSKGVHVIEIDVENEPTIVEAVDMLKASLVEHHRRMDMRATMARPMSYHSQRG